MILFKYTVNCRYDWSKYRRTIGPQNFNWIWQTVSPKLTWWWCINDGNTRPWSQPWPSSPGYSTVWRWIANKERSIGAVGINSKKEVTEGAFADSTRTQYHNPWLRKIVYCVVAAVNDTWTKCLLDLNIEIFPGLENFQNWNATRIFHPYIYLLTNPDTPPCGSH